MHKVYLLLRNNKQLGPYTLEELLQQSLKPFDLVWVEGRSVGWKYPSEIDALKPYLSETPQPAEVKKELPVLQEINQPIQVEEKKPVAKKRVYVSLPGSAVASTPVEEESFSQKLERKAEELYKRAQAFAEQKNKAETRVEVKTDNNVDPANKAAVPEIDTKYARSLDDIKEEYSNWLYEQKRNKKTSNRRLKLIVAGSIVVCALGFTTMKLFFTEKTSSVLAEQKPADPSVEEVTEVKPVFTPAKASKKTGRKVSRQITSTNNITAKKSGEKKQTTRKKDIVTTSAKKENTTSKAPQKNSVFLPDLVKITGVYSANKKCIPDFSITVSNNSEEAIRFVAVDVYYYKNDGTLAGKKTLYFNKLAARQSMTQTAPGNAKADDVIFKMGLLSSGNGELYYAKQ